MLVNRVQAEFIGTNRIDPDYYRPEHLADEKHLRHFGSDELGTVGDFVAGPFGSKLPSDLYLSAGVPLFRVGNVGSMEVLLEGMAHLAPEVHEELSDSEVIPGDLLIVKASVGEKICRVPSWMPRANITQHIIGIRPNGHADMDYVAAFLFCQYGRRQLVRRSLGSIIQYLGITDSKDVLFPRIKSKVQTFIGGKVRQAERLRSCAKTLQGEAEVYFSLPGMEAVRIGEFRAYRAASAVADSIRLDPKFYDPGHFKLQELLRQHQPVPISQLAMPVSLRWAREEPDFFYLEIGELDLASGLVKPTRLATVDAPSRATTLVQPGDVLVSTVRPNRKNVGLVPEVGEPLPIVASSGFSVLRFRSPEEAAFYLFWLRSDAATMQLMRWDAGSSYPAIDESVPLKVLVPRYADEVVREKGARWYQSFHAQVLAEKLTTAAKLLVEALIEGKVTEAELVLAQEALERGDATADRALLRRLTRQGLDVPGQPPLFPDLDALYTLLNQTKTADSQ